MPPLMSFTDIWMWTLTNTVLEQSYYKTWVHNTESSVSEDQSIGSQSDKAQGHGEELRGWCPVLPSRLWVLGPRVFGHRLRNHWNIYIYFLSNTLYLNKNPTAGLTLKCVCVLEYNGSWPFWFAGHPFWKVKVLFSQSRLTLTTLWIVAHRAPLSTDFFRQEYGSG